MRRRLMAFVLKLGTSAGLVWLIVSRQDFSDLIARAASVSVAGAVLIVFLLLMQCIVASVRWGWIIRSMNYSVPFRRLLRAWLIGHFLGQGFPSTIGHDGYRVISLRWHGLAIRDALEIILLDRFTGVAALLLLAALTMPILHGLAVNKAVLIPVEVGVAVAFVLTALVFTRLSIPAAFSRFPAIDTISRFRANLRRMVATRHNILWIALPAVIAHMLSVFAAYFIALEAEAHMSFLQCLAIIPTAILISLVPLTIAGWGIREGAIVGGGLLIGIPAADALFVSVMLGFGFLAVGLVGGVVWLLSGEVPAAVAQREEH